MNKWNKWALWCLTLSVVALLVLSPTNITRVKNWWAERTAEEEVSEMTVDETSSEDMAPDTQTLYHTKGLDYPVYVPANSWFHWDETPNEGVILFRFARNEQDLAEAKWRRLEGEYFQLPAEIADGAIYIDFRLPEEIGQDNEIEITVVSKKAKRLRCSASTAFLVFLFTTYY